MKTTPNKLNIQPKEAELLTKEQLEFNLLLDRMNKAEAKIQIERQFLDTLLEECISKVYPVHLDFIKLDLQIIEELFTYFKNTKLSASRRRSFTDYINEKIDFILFCPNGMNDDQAIRILEIQKEIYKVEEEKKTKKDKLFEAEMEFEILRGQLELELIERGFIIDLSELKMEMSSEEINNFVEDKIRNYGNGNSQNRNTQQHKKKSKKQIEKETKEAEIEELKGKSLSSIYKSLAKIIHPDLEQNPEKRNQKEQWMKMLTVAYEKKDLKTLLEIELEWAKGESDNIETIALDKLKLYNQMLRSQVQEMEIAAATVYNEQKYGLLLYFTDGPYKLKRWRPVFSTKPLMDRIRNSEIILEILEKQDIKTKKLIDLVIKDHQQTYNSEW
jgi:hypothetical protein